MRIPNPDTAFAEHGFAHIFGRAAGLFDAENAKTITRLADHILYATTDRCTGRQDHAIRYRR